MTRRIMTRRRERTSLMDDISRRSPFRLADAMQSCAKSKAAGCKATSCLKHQIRMRNSCFKQSRHVEVGFLSERLVESKARNSDVSATTVYHTLVDSELFEGTFDYGTHGKAAFPAMRNAKIEDIAYHGDPSNASMPFSIVSSTSRTSGFLTHTPKPWTRHFCEPGLLRDLRARMG